MEGGGGWGVVGAYGPNLILVRGWIILTHARTHRKRKVMTAACLECPDVISMLLLIAT